MRRGRSDADRHPDDDNDDGTNEIVPEEFDPWQFDGDREHDSGGLP